MRILKLLSGIVIAPLVLILSLLVGIGLGLLFPFMIIEQCWSMEDWAWDVLKEMGS